VVSEQHIGFVLTSATHLPKHWQLPTKLYGITTQKTTIDIFTAMSTSLLPLKSYYTNGAHYHTVVPKLCSGGTVMFRELEQDVPPLKYNGGIFLYAEKQS
jgi:hypothetical protein